MSDSGTPSLEPSVREAAQGVRRALSDGAARLADLASQDNSRLISPTVVTGVVRLVDVLLIGGIGIGLFYLYVNEVGGALSLLYMFATITAAILSGLIFQAFKIYSVHALTNLVKQASRLWMGWTSVFALLVAIAFMSKTGAEFSRVWLVVWYFLGLSALICARVILATAVRRWIGEGRFDRRTLIIGGGGAGEKLISELEESEMTDIRICGVFDDRGDERVSSVVAGYPKLGNVNALVEFARQTRIDLLIVTLPLTAEARLLEIFQKLWVLPVDIRLAAHTNRLSFRPRAYSFLGSVPVIDVSDKPITGWDSVIKWLFDKFFAFVALVVLSPIMAAVALAIRLDSKGPALFRQKRYGFNNELIEVFKFRSMYTEQADVGADRLVTKDDSRVTRVGRFIRRTSLDELPQLFNVLRGEISLVGPRPHALQAKAADQLYNDVVDGYFARHKVKPGITGWAQVNGWRGETDTQEKIQKRVEHDLYYIENWSAFFDLYILLRTPFALLNTESAY